MTAKAKANDPKPGAKTYDFTLLLNGATEITGEIENALFEAGCDDATLSQQHGCLYLEFSRTATSIQEAILSAIHDVRKANCGLDVMRIDHCDLVYPSEIARRVERSRQQIHQYITAERGPGGFPPPVYYVAEDKPLWAWSDVTDWLQKNGLADAEVAQEAEVISTINAALGNAFRKARHPKLVEEVEKSLKSSS